MVTSSKSIGFAAAGRRLGKPARFGVAPRQTLTPRQPWVELLSDALRREILPRVLLQQRADAEFKSPSDLSGSLPAAAVAGFVELIIGDDMEQARAIADRVIVQTGSREALLDVLLTPAARLLGVMWERDTADFVTVTLGVYRLDQIMKETAAAGRIDRLANACDYRILLIPVPGEQHSFGLGMVADAFREGGWCVRAGPAVTRAKLLHLVRNEWFDIIGFSVASERWLEGLPSCIRAIRAASCNKQAFVMAGGQAIANHLERTRFLGIDATALDAREALTRANVFMESTVTAGLHQSRSRLI